MHRDADGWCYELEAHDFATSLCLLVLSSTITIESISASSRAASGSQASIISPAPISTTEPTPVQNSGTLPMTTFDPSTAPPVVSSEATSTSLSHSTTPSDIESGSLGITSALSTTSPSNAFTASASSTTTPVSNAEPGARIAIRLSICLMFLSTLLTLLW